MQKRLFSMFYYSTLAGVLMISLVPSNASAACRLPSMDGVDLGDWVSSAPFIFADANYGEEQQFEQKDATANLYVYDLGLTHIGAQEVEQEIRKSMAEASNSYRSGLPDNMEVGPPFWMPDYLLQDFETWQQLGGAFSVLDAADGSLLAFSTVSVGQMDSCFYKIRYTFVAPEHFESSETDPILIAKAVEELRDLMRRISFALGR